MFSRKTMMLLIALAMTPATNLLTFAQKAPVHYPQAGHTQGTVPNPAPAATPAPDTAPVPAAQVPAPGTPAEADATMASNSLQGPSAACQAMVKASAANPAKKGKKVPYTGPAEIVVLAPTPMLDSEGRQQLDPDAKPMFNPPVKQQRDKYGHPVFDELCRPVFQTEKELGYDEKGKKIGHVKEKPPKLTPVSVQHGTFTVDGIVGKATLNYDIADLKYLYFYVPGMGVAIVSNVTFPGAKEQPLAFNDKSLKVTVSDHALELASDTRLMVGTKKPASAFVRVDREFVLPAKFPVVGYGTLRAPPYAWPGAKPEKKIEGTVAAPPIPVNLRPVLALQPCPAGFMRTAVKVLPGQTTPPQPCVPIPKGAATVKGASGATGSTGAKGASGATGSTGMAAGFAKE